MDLDPLALTADEQEQIVAVLLLTGIITRIDLFNAANARISAECERVTPITESAPGKPRKTAETARGTQITAENPGNWRIGAKPWERCVECNQPRPVKVLNKNGICPRCLLTAIKMPPNPLLAQGTPTL